MSAVALTPDMVGSPELAALVETDPILRLYCATDSATVPLLQAPADVERVARPLLRVFRVLLDRYERCLPPLDRLGVEVSARGEPTGRIVVGAELDPPAEAQARLADIRRAVRAEDVVAAELRYVRLETVTLLGPPAHTVTPGQDAILRAVIDRVAEQARRRRTEPVLPRPVVVLDVDLTALDPRRRIEHALRAVGGAIPELADPARLAVLPRDTERGWSCFLDRTGLGKRYPSVDWAALFGEYLWTYHRPWEHLAWDVPTAGLRRFSWLVRDAGGEVIFCTGRRERVRRYTEVALARAGFVRPRLLMLPDDRTRPVAELKAEHLRRLAGVVAVFDDRADDRRAAAKALPGAEIIPVGLAGYASESEERPAVVTFETIPRSGLTAPAGRPPVLSHTHSLAELPIADLAAHPVAREHAVHLTDRESREIVAALVRAADASAAALAGNARRRGQDTEWLIHHLFTRPRFVKGARGNLPLPAARAAIGPAVAAGEPVPVVLAGFPVKLHYSGLKTAGTMPDLAELALLVRLRELQRAVRAVYPPGLRITVLADGYHYRDRPAAMVDAYHATLRRYRDLVGCEGLDVFDQTELVRRRLGADGWRRRAERVEQYRYSLTAALAGLPVDTDPLRAAAAADEICRTALPLPAGAPPFTPIFSSLAYSVALPSTGLDTATWARRLYAGVFDLADPDPAVAAGRRQVLATAWADAIGYFAVAQADRELGCDDVSLFPRRVRLTGHPRPGCLGLSYLGGSGVAPWHGVAATDAAGRLGVDFAVALADQGFVPVYSPLLGLGQPWLMVPVTATRGGRLDPAFHAAIRLRRR